MPMGPSRFASLPDDEAVRLFKLTGNPDYFALLFERHRRLVLERCFQTLGNAADAEDAAQDTFCRAYRLIGYDESGSFRAWLTTIAARLSLNRKTTRPRLACS